MRGKKGESMLLDSPPELALLGEVLDRGCEEVRTPTQDEDDDPDLDDEDSGEDRQCQPATTGTTISTQHCAELRSGLLAHSSAFRL